MTKKPTTTKTVKANNVPPVVNNTVSNCSFVAEAGKTSPEVARAVEALAQASAKHAEAMSAMARALQGTPGTFQTGIHIGSGQS